MARRRTPLQRRAYNIAAAGVSTPKSIRRDYTRQIQNSRGWASAAASLLKGNEGAASDAYQSAVDQQRQIDSAAQDALHQLGPEYAGAAVAQQGITGSGLSSLLQAKGAAGAYAAAQPGIASARGDLAARGLQQGMLDALQQRRDTIARAYPAIFEQLRSTQFNENMANRQFAESRRQFNVSTGLQRQQMSQQQAQFDASQAQQWQEFLMGQADKKTTANQSTWNSLTPGQRQQQMSDVADSIDQAIHGVPNPNYGKQTPSGQTDNRRWIVKPYGTKGGAPQKSPTQVYNDLRAHGYSQVGILKTFQMKYPPATFVGFLSSRLPKLYQQLYADTTPKGYPH